MFICVYDYLRSKPFCVFSFQWNNHGYDVAKTFSAKFDVISPVWLQVQRKANGKYELHGKHDLDMGWADDVRRLNKNTKGETNYTRPRSCGQSP